MANNRIFYACQAVAVKHRPYNTSTEAWDAGDIEQLEGIQSVGINTNFNLEQIFELGQLEIYENVEGIPEVEVTIEKALDNKALVYHACSTRNEKVTQTTQDRADVSIAIYPDSGNADGVEGNQVAHVKATGMYVSSVSYTFSVDGNATESVTFVGNSKTWTASDALNPEDTPDGTAAPGTGGVVRREDFALGTSTIPSTVSNAGKLQSVTISSDFSREDILELGSFVPYYRAAGFPIEVSCEFEVVATDGDNVTVSEAGGNISDETIIIKAGNSSQYVFNLGTKNKLTSIAYGGGDAGGGNATITFGYINYNDLIVAGPAVS